MWSSSWDTNSLRFPMKKKLFNIQSKIGIQLDCLAMAASQSTCSIMKSLVIGTDPTYYKRNNESATEKIVMLGKVCIHREIHWNPTLMSSFGSHDSDLALVDIVSLPHDILSFTRGVHQHLADSPVLVGIMKASAVDFSWSVSKNVLIRLLMEQGHFDFVPTHLSSREAHTIAIEESNNINCIHCQQDFCFWELNTDIIQKEVKFMCGALWQRFYSPRDQIFLASSLCMFALHSLSSSRAYCSQSFPTCVVDGCNMLYLNLTNNTTNSVGTNHKLQSIWRRLVN